jgi:hypothetical protein
MSSTRVGGVKITLASDLGSLRNEVASASAH